MTRWYTGGGCLTSCGVLLAIGETTVLQLVGATECSTTQTENIKHFV
jgi:hypothetical protein